MKKIRIKASEISSWELFHNTFGALFDFDYYGRNMDAWIDCLGDFAISEKFVSLEIEGMKELKKLNREIFDAINECSAFVNFRHTEQGGTPIVALSYCS